MTRAVVGMEAPDAEPGDVVADGEGVYCFQRAEAHTKPRWRVTRVVRFRAEEAIEMPQDTFHGLFHRRGIGGDPVVFIDASVA